LTSYSYQHYYKVLLTGPPFGIILFDLLLVCLFLDQLHLWYQRK